MGMCSKCSGISGWLFLIFGVLFLLNDFGIWDVFGITAWSALFVIIGLGFLGSSHCGDCRAMSGHTKKK